MVDRATPCEDGEEMVHRHAQHWQRQDTDQRRFVAAYAAPD
jgi:hypothetical protein